MTEVGIIIPKVIYDAIAARCGGLSVSEVCAAIVKHGARDEFIFGHALREVAGDD